MRYGVTVPVVDTLWNHHLVNFLVLPISLSSGICPFGVSIWRFAENCTSSPFMLNECFLSMQVHVKCLLVYMDIEGRSDGGSIKKILSHVSPLKLVRPSSVLLEIFAIFYYISYSRRKCCYINLYIPIISFTLVTTYSCQYSAWTLESWHEKTITTNQMGYDLYSFFFFCK